MPRKKYRNDVIILPFSIPQNFIIDELAYVNHKGWVVFKPKKKSKRGKNV